MFAAVQEITYNALTAFTTEDLELAYRIEPLEEVIDSLCDEMKLHHVDRLQRGICKLDQGFVFNDLLTNYERVADHCSNLAVAMIELESASFDTHEYMISLKKARPTTSTSTTRSTRRSLPCRRTEHQPAGGSPAPPIPF